MFDTYYGFPGEMILQLGINSIWISLDTYAGLVGRNVDAL
jgi:hypothetical protein